MGIDKLRFPETISISITEFYCGICGDVVYDPVLTKECEHCVCRSCITADIRLCPTCGIKLNGFDEFGVALRRVYSNIKLRCVYKTCEEPLTIETFQAHERKCPEGFYDCPNLCGFRLRLSLDEAQRVHNCIEILLSRVNALTASHIDVQRMNERLNAQVEGLQMENADLRAALGSQRKRRVTCGALLAKGENFYRCYTCQIRRMSVICADCFGRGQHGDHRFALMVTETDNFYCDCGDTIAMHESATCSKHAI